MAQDNIVDGPFGGFGGQPYREQHNSQRLKKVDAWGTSYAGYFVLGGFQLTWPDGHQSDLVGKIDANHHSSFNFDDDEKITSMIVYAGDGEGFVNGIHFETNKPQHGAFDVGGTEGKQNPLDVGNGEWVGAESRDPSVPHDGGAEGVVDNIRVYFNE
ncbi:hypothetical protein P175DRAFT_0217466 [Aspergillus ochraceoroseus IBT 24754]|uniref:Jacalin-type lectin domain-containing protein n=3 Tax=Aspergillus subgen. Nidulantes TaxID=2720870 RepID=A0A0F8V2D4_9EURO|nr:uncharacterized protein P175DRAFT_0217466 [Aspergillus ochraceoroseus IBT 24754]KKK22198.1 hypothetical protein AOCH_001500 [Aspergillus ochraceoroseus]KKK25924.1 hypothetical protein ARAM_007154 [Aspergillus rambellii]PTU20464.1 hypothetical protein P175DRAFT_0217466 [Aspergillus ochraceoroseus IBT 24754]